MHKKFLFLVVFFILIPLNVFSQVTYDSNKKLLSVKSEGSLLSEIFSEMSAKTGIDVYISPAADRKVFVDIKDEPVQDAIRMMVKPLNYSFIYQGTSIKTVKVFERFKTEATARIAPSGRSRTTTSSSAAQILKNLKEKKQPPTKQDLETLVRERKREVAISRGNLKELEAKEAEKEKRRKEREMKREERRMERERMREEGEEGTGERKVEGMHPDRMKALKQIRQR